MGDLRPPFDVAKRCLYAALRHLHTPLDCVVEGDDLSSYKMVLVTDLHVSRAGTKQLAEWVNAGGRLVATAGAGLYDEFNRPNDAFAALLGHKDRQLVEPKGEPIRFEKQDLPFAKPIDNFDLGLKQLTTPVFGLRTRTTLFQGTGLQLGKFADQSPVVTSISAGKGKVDYLAFLPGLTYFKSALPLRPVDRGANDDTMAHFLPTDFNTLASDLLRGSLRHLEPFLECSLELK